MNIKKVLILGASIFTLVGCSNDENILEQSETGNEIRITRIGANTGSENESRVATNGVNVTYARYDDIGLIKTSEATTNTRYLLSS